MNSLLHRAVIVPLLLFAALFAFDKIFYLKPVRDRVLLYKKVEPDMYDSRRDLLKQLIADYPENRQQGRKLGIILGSSRSAAFDTRSIEKVLPGTVTYNFSVPMGGIAHAYYYAYLLHKNDIRPSFIMLEADIVNFSQPSLSFALSYDFDPLFVLEHTNFFDPDDPETGGFRPDEADTFFLKYLFALYRYPLDPKNIIENYKIMPGTNQRQLEFRKQHQKMLVLANRKNLGGIPNPLEIEATEEDLEKDARMVRDRVLGNSISQTQLLLFKRLLALARKEKIPLLVYRPVVSYPFAKILENMDASFQERVIRSSVEKTEGVFYVDPEAERPLRCRAFVDALHLSGVCYPELTDRLFKPMRSVLTAR